MCRRHFLSGKKPLQGSVIGSLQGLSCYLFTDRDQSLLSSSFWFFFFLLEIPQPTNTAVAAAVAARLPYGRLSPVLARLVPSTLSVVSVLAVFRSRLAPLTFLVRDAPRTLKVSPVPSFTPQVPFSFRMLVMLKVLLPTASTSSV